MDDHHQHLGRGFNWLGGAAITAKAIDFMTILAVLTFLTKDQVGTAALVISAALVIEAFNGLGTGEALIQAPMLSRLQLDTLFWYIVGAAAALAGLTLIAAPLIASAYGAAGMVGYFWIVAAKQPLVGAAVIPMALMSRELQYERIAVVNVSATLAAALTRLGLAISGAGVWALVIGQAASGLYIMIGAFVAKPFRPALRFQIQEIAPLVQFGVRAAASNFFEQTFKNIDYLLIGWFYGPTALAVYRVAFDMAMEPAMAVGTVISRTAMPVFARVSALRAQLMQSLTWSLRRLMMLAAPLLVTLVLIADPVMALLHDQNGNSYAAAALPLKLLAAAAFLRTASQILPPLMLGTGRPGMAARLSALVLALVTVGILVAGFTLPARSGIVAISGIWLFTYPIILVWGTSYLRRHWGIRFRDLASAFLRPGATMAGAVLLVVIARLTIANPNPWVQIGIVLAAMLLSYGIELWYVRRAGPRMA